MMVALRGSIARLCCPVDLEYYCVVMACLLSAVYSFCGQWYIAQLFGRDPYQAFGSDVEASECFLLLFMGLVSITCCSAMPIRAHLTWVVPTWGVSMFCFVTWATSTPHLGALPSLLGALCCVNGLAVFGALKNDSHLRKEWLAQRQIEKQKDLSEKQRQGFSHILHRMCDCLLHLGRDFEITEPSPNLAAMLFLADETRLQDKCFCDFLASVDDHTRFVAAVGKGVSDEEPAGTIPLHLRDTQGRHVQVHAHFTCFDALDGTPNYIVGIVEAGEPGEQFVGAESAEAQGVSHNDPKTTAEGRPVRERSSPSIDSSASLSESEMALQPVSCSDLGEVSVTIDDSPGFNIISCTSGFTALSGPIGGGTKLTDLIVDPREFQVFLQENIEEFIAGHDFEKLVLRTPSARAAGIEYVVTSVTLDAIDYCGDASKEYPFTMRVRLGTIRQRPQRHDRRGTSRTSSKERLTRLCQL